MPNLQKICNYGHTGQIKKDFFSPKPLESKLPTKCPSNHEYFIVYFLAYKTFSLITTIQPSKSENLHCYITIIYFSDHQTSLHNCPNNIFCKKESNSQLYIAFDCHNTLISFTGSSSNFPSISTFIILKIVGQSFCRLYLNLFFSDVVS